MNKIYNGVATEFEDYFDKLIDAEKKQVELYYNVKKEEIYEQKIKEQDKEIDRLNNIINELERHLHQEILEWQDNNDNWIKAQVQEDKVILDKLKELKEE